MQLESLLKLGRVIRVIGFDDAPFSRRAGKSVSIAGVICGGTRFEGMVWGEVEQDGLDATETICKLLAGKSLCGCHAASARSGCDKTCDPPASASGGASGNIAACRHNSRLPAVFFPSVW